MKKTISIFFFLFFLILFASCKNTAPDTTVPPTEATSVKPQESESVQTISTEPEPSYPEPSYPDQVSISLQQVSEDYFSDNDALLFKFSHPSIQVKADNTSLAKSIVTYFESELSSPEILETIDQITTSASEQYSPDSYWAPYSFTIQYLIPRNDAAAISFFGAYDYFSGGAHPNRYLKSANFDANTGLVISLDEIINNTEQLDVLMDFVLQKLSKTDENVVLFDDYVNVVRQHFTKDSSEFGKWYFSENGLVFYFSTYEIAPYAAGEWFFEIPYTDLQDILLDDYLPQIETAYSGTLKADEKENVSLESKEPIGQLYLTDDGPNIILYTEGNITNLTINQGYWNFSDSFQPSGTLFSTTILSQKSYIFLRSLLQEDHSKIQISYHDGGITQIRYLSVDMDTGSIILKDQG